MLPSSNAPRAILSKHTSLGSPMDKQPENALYRAALEEFAHSVSEEAKASAPRKVTREEWLASLEFQRAQKIARENQQIAAISVSSLSGKSKQRPKQSRPRRKRGRKRR